MMNGLSLHPEALRSQSVHGRFGPAPAPGATLPAHTVLVGQMVVCTAGLLLIQPPFAMAPPPPGAHELGPSLSLSRVLALAFAATSATWLLHSMGVGPLDSFQGACEVMYRASR